MDDQEKQNAYNQKLILTKAFAELDSKQKEVSLSASYVKAYLWSIVIPPIGIYYFIRYVFLSDGEPESIKAGIVSLVLTLVSLVLSLLLTFYVFRLLTAGTAQNSQMQMLKDLTVPDNQKTLLKLLQ